MIPWQVYAGGALIAFLLAAYFLWARALRKQGELQQRAATAEKGNEDARDAIKISEANSRLSDDDLRRKL